MTSTAGVRSVIHRVSLSRLIIFLPFALVAAWLILRQAAILLDRDSPALWIPSLWPVSGATVIAESGIRGTPATKVSPAIADRLGQALLGDPLAPEPFYAAAALRVRQKDHRAAIALLEQARRREPRWVTPRLMLAQQYLIAG